METKGRCISEKDQGQQEVERFLRETKGHLAAVAGHLGAIVKDIDALLESAALDNPRGHSNAKG